MSYGLVIRNQAGAVVVDSDYRHTVFYDKYTPGITDTHYYNIKVRLGNMYDLGYLAYNNFPVPGYLYWFRMQPNTFSFPGAWMYQPGVEIIRTSREKPIQKGYLNVYNGSGSLVWSDISSYDMPRIRGFISPTLDIDNNIQSIRPGFNPWILMNNCPGNLTEDDLFTGYSGMFFRWNGADLQYTWEQKAGRTFNSVFGGVASLNIPYAFFNYGR
ncbi:hypothetical protein [Enterobacter phage ATCEA23]|nr:uncharacterized protein [Enterobacter phage ATCEA85]QQV93489.1 hypothetical protein [Enterobacter phage ATCEA23]